MYFIDVQGTLIDDTDRLPIPGAIAFIDTLNAQNIPYVIVTNNTKRSSAAFLAYLNGIGFTIPPQRYFAAMMLLERQVPKQRVAAYGNEALLSLLGSLGVELDYETPKTVLLCVTADYDAAALAQMIAFLSGGAQLVGMHETSLYVREGKRYPGTGALLRLLSCAADVPFQVIGKPSKGFYLEALELLCQQVGEVGFEAVTMISDDYAGDLVGAMEMGMQGALVLSGKIHRDDTLVKRLRSEESGAVVYNDISKIMRRDSCET